VHRRCDDPGEPLITHKDVTALMDILGRISANVEAIRLTLEDEDDGEENDPEADR
jgi:hypothetical protein